MVGGGIEALTSMCTIMTGIAATTDILTRTATVIEGTATTVIGIEVDMVAMIGTVIPAVTANVCHHQRSARPASGSRTVNFAQPPLLSRPRDIEA